MSKANWANPENQEVANEAWFSSKPKHDDTSELVDKVNRKISAIKELVRDGKLLADYRDMVKKISAVKLPADKAKALALSLANKHYEENVEKIPVSNFSTPEQLFSVIFVTQHPCQEDYNQGYVCLEHLQKSSAYRSDPVLTAIFSQCEVFESRMQLLLDNGKHAEAILNKALAVVNDEQALADVYKSYDKSLKFDQWSYCAYGEPLEKYDGLRLVESLAKSVPMELLTRLSKKAEELITAHKGKNKSIVKGFIGILAGNLDCIRTFYTSMEYHIKESNKVFQQLNSNVGVEGWFSSKPKHSALNDMQTKLKGMLDRIESFEHANSVIANYHDMQKKIASVKLTDDKAKAFVEDHCDEDYEKQVANLPASLFSTSAIAYAVNIVTDSPCQEDYNNDYKCLARILKSSAFKSQPILTAIASQTGILPSELIYLTDGKLGQVLDKAIMFAKAHDSKGLDAHYEEFRQDLEFEHWGYCYNVSNAFEAHNGLKLIELLSKVLPKATLEQLYGKVAELITVDDGKDNASVKGFVETVNTIFHGVRDFYHSMYDQTQHCLKLVEKVGTEGFGDFYSETMQVNDFAMQYDQEHQLDTPYRMVKVDAKGNITQHGVLLENGTGTIMEESDILHGLDPIALESAQDDGKSLIARLIEKIKQFFSWLLSKLGVTTIKGKDVEYDSASAKVTRDEAKHILREVERRDLEQADELLKSSSVDGLRIKTTAQRNAALLFKRHYRRDDKVEIIRTINASKKWDTHPFEVIGVLTIGLYPIIKGSLDLADSIDDINRNLDAVIKFSERLSRGKIEASDTRELENLPELETFDVREKLNGMAVSYSIDNLDELSGSILEQHKTDIVEAELAKYKDVSERLKYKLEQANRAIDKAGAERLADTDRYTSPLFIRIRNIVKLVSNINSVMARYTEYLMIQDRWTRKLIKLLGTVQDTNRKVAYETFSWANTINSETQVNEMDTGMNELLDMESDAEEFDFVLDNETLGVDELEDYVSNDVEESKPEIVAGLESYGGLIASKGMCKEYYTACESLQPGIFSEINPNRLTALPSRTLQAVALEAVEGEQKKSLVARLIEKIKQFFNWILSKLGLGPLKGKDKDGNEVEVEYDSAAHKDAVDEANSEIVRESASFQEKRSDGEKSHFDALHANTSAQRLAKHILSKHYKSTGAALIVKKINGCPAWNKYPMEVVGALLTGPCYFVKDSDYIDRGIKSMEEHMTLILKISNMIKDGTINKWDSSEVLDVARIDNQNLYKDSLDSVLVINDQNLNKFHGGILENNYSTKFGQSIEVYTEYAKALKVKISHTKEAFEHINNTANANNDIVLSALTGLFTFTMQSLNNVNGMVRKHTHAMIMQERWIRRLTKLIKKNKLKPATESFIGWAQPTPNWCTPGLEAIDFQYKSKLFSRLTKWCAELRMAKVFTSKALQDSDLGKIIEEETNLQFIFKIDPVTDPNAAVLTVQLDRNNPIYANFIHNFLDNDELLRAKSLMGNTIEGLIDYQKAKVGGIFAKVKNTMWLTIGLIQSNLLSDEEVAAVICHEIGHTFTIFSQIASLVSLNYIVDDLSKRLLGTNDKKVQITILHEYDTKYGIKLPEDEILATVDNKQKFVTKIVTDVVKNSRNSEGDYVFSLRNCEMAADQFAARMGAGRAIVTGLNKMYAAWGQDQYNSKTVHYIIQAFQIVLNVTLIGAGLFVMPFFSAIFIFSMVVARPQEKVYDDPMERFTRVRNEYIVALKRLDISREMKQVYLDDIKTMDTVISAMNKNVGWLEWVWNNWIPSGKRTKAAIDYQQLIERMGNNDLFMKSASYELLIEDLKNA